ncbi:MAG: molybdopterin converting factor subunit 1 [Aestuariivita sp.]|nr:molybdopterin converting factor subunit 1 [Aestuariivita sp.]
MEVLYFAWVRERIGIPKETIVTQAKTVFELIEELKVRSGHYETAFSDTSALRVAVDQQLTDFDASIEEAKEIAFFPPMTGG